MAQKLPTFFNGGNIKGEPKSARPKPPPNPPLVRNSYTPHHDKLDGGEHGFNHVGPIPRSMVAAYAYVDRVLHTADVHVGISPAWHGWALREAFLAGIAHAKEDAC
jgi:hypothetical protein